jgi:hypothetical protein
MATEKNIVRQGGLSPFLNPAAKRPIRFCPSGVRFSREKRDSVCARVQISLLAGSCETIRDLVNIFIDTENNLNN